MVAITTREHVRQLLSSTEHDPTLVIHRGEALVLPAAEIGEGPYAGALVVASKDDIVRQMTHGELSEQDLAELAERLAAAVANLGG